MTTLLFIYIIMVGFAFAYLYADCIRPTFIDVLICAVGAFVVPIMVPWILCVVIYDNFLRR